MLEALNGLSKADAELNVDGYFKAAVVITNYINGIIDKLDLSSSQLNIGQLFVGSTEWNILLENVFHLTPNVISGMMKITARPDMVMI